MKSTRPSGTGIHQGLKKAAKETPRQARPERTRERPLSPGRKGPETVSFGTKKLPIPKDAYVEEMTSADNQLLLRLRLRDGSCQIIAIDLNTGGHIGTLLLTDDE